MASQPPVLTTSRYVEPGVYIGELLSPEAANLSADVRIPTIIAKGSRYAVAFNQPILRAFINAASVTFSVNPPFIAPLVREAKGDQSPPNRLYKSDGTELRQEEWAYVADINSQFFSIQIRDESYDPTASYLFDYQSVDRSVTDAIPVAEVRQIRALGNQIDSDQYREYSHYYVPMDFIAPSGNPDNTNPDSAFDAVVDTLQPGSTGSVVVTPSAIYENAYDRHYKLTCLSVAGVTPTRTATFEWEAVNLGGGNDAAPPVPLQALIAKPQFIINEAVPASLTQALELGVSFDFSFGGTHFVAGDEFDVDAFGPSVIELDARYNSPQWATVSAPALVAGATGDFQMLLAPTTNYTNARNNKFRVELVSVAGVTPNRVYTFGWARYGDVMGASGSFVINENNSNTYTQLLTNGVRVEVIFGVADAVAGATWEMSAQAPRIYYRAKDSRNYALSIASVVTNLTTTTVSGGFTTDTTEGAFGTWSAQFDSSDGNPDGYTLLPDNVSIAVRNAQRFAALDEFTFSVLNTEVIAWDLTAQSTDVRELTDYLLDTNGAITGVAGQKYVILANVPTDGNSIQVVNANTSNPVSFNWISGTPFVFFTVDPAVPLEITYMYRGPEPDPGQVYYLTCTFLRPNQYYNVPFLALRLDDGRAFAAPSTVDNDLYIGNEVAWDNAAPAVYLVQPKNVDGSGNYTVPDFVPAVRSIRSYPRVSDLCLLNYLDALPEVLNENILGNDPFEQRPNLVWVGLPIGTPIGDENTDGSIVQYARRTLQVRGDSAAKGSRILVAETRCTKQIVLDSGVTTTVTLDGSFLALAGASRVASFADPATDILKTQVNGFATIDIYKKEQIRIVGQAQCLYIKGSPGAYTWGEDTTVDSTKNFERIQLMTQRHFVTKVVAREMEVLVGITPASGFAGRQLVRGQLASILRGLLGKGLIGQYQDATGNPRVFDPEADIIVFQDQNDLSLYYFNYCWFSRNVVKRMFGLYQLNGNDFSRGTALT